MPNYESGFIVPLTLLLIVIVASGVILGGSLILKALTGKENQVTQIISMPTPKPASTNATSSGPSCSDKNVYTIKDQEMFPSYFQSDTWQYQEYLESSPQRGDVVILENPFEKDVQVIRRVVGLPGEDFKILSNRVYINGQVLSEAYLHDTFPQFEANFIKNNKEILIPPGKYILLADNRSTLSDSRNWGFIEDANIEKKLVKRITTCTKSNLTLNPGNDEMIKNDISILHDLLDCHFTKDKKYPNSIYAINSTCLNEARYVVHFNPNTNAPYNYVLNERGYGYNLKTTISTGKDYSSTADDLYYDGNSLFKDPDQKRLSEINDLTLILNKIVENVPTPSAGVVVIRNQLCNGLAKCSGQTYPSKSNSSSINGSGWVKANLTSQSLDVLPIDPKNTSKYHYSYCAQGENWEINFVLAASENKNLMINDKGDNPNRYEVGNNLTLFDKGGCIY